MAEGAGMANVGWVNAALEASRMKPKDAVQWLLDFAAKDLSGLSDAERRQTLLELEGFLGPWGVGVATMPRKYRDLILGQCHQEATTGLASYLTGRGWSVEVTLSMRASHAGWSEFRSGDLYQVFAFVAVTSLKTVGPALKRCANAQCGVVFVSEGRQAYCSRLCSDRVRASKHIGALERDPERKAAALARRRELYAEKQRARFGRKTIVGKQRLAGKQG
jgi:hypothetical protein